VRQESVYRGIVGIDIERYSRAEWTDPIRARLRERLHRVVDHALAHAAIDPALTRRSDVGDGMWLLVAAEVSTARLLHPLLTGLVSGLGRGHRRAPAAERMRLRLVVQAGEVLPDAHGETVVETIEEAVNRVRPFRQRQRGLNGARARDPVTPMGGTASGTSSARPAPLRPGGRRWPRFRAGTAGPRPALRLADQGHLPAGAGRAASRPRLCRLRERETAVVGSLPKGSALWKVRDRYSRSSTCSAGGSGR
jgi:hypothetical protein